MMCTIIKLGEMWTQNDSLNSKQEIHKAKDGAPSALPSSNPHTMLTLSSKSHG